MLERHIYTMTKNLTLCGVFTTLALIFSYIERITLDVGIPGVKLGIANLVIVIILYTLGAKAAFGVNILRIVMAGILFGNVSSIIYSLSGGILSFMVMYLLKKTNLFSMAGISMAGGVFHIIGQVCMAAIVVNNAKMLYSLPVLSIVGLLTGLLLGILAHYLIKPIRQVLGS